MREFITDMQRARGISEEERRRRMHQAYQILRDADRSAKQRTTADTGEAYHGSPASADGETPAKERDVTKG